MVISCLLLPLREQNTPLKCFQLALLMLSLTCFQSPTHSVHISHTAHTCIDTQTRFEEWSRAENPSQINNRAFVTSTCCGLHSVTYAAHFKKEDALDNYTLLPVKCSFSNDAVFQITSSFLCILG